MKGKTKLSGVLLIITALIIMQLPVSEADAATSASDFKMEGSTLVKYRGTDTTVSIPDTVEVIGKSAFEDNDEIELVVIPKSVKKIEAYAFWSCDCLEEVVLGKGLTEVGDYAFTNCKGLKKMAVPSNVRYIGIQSFADCVNMTDVTIAPEVTQIHETAFDGCAKLVIHCKKGSYAEKYAESFYEKQKEMPEYEDVPEYSKPEDNGDAGDAGDDEDAENNTNDGYQENGNLLGSTQIVGNQAVVFIDNTSPQVLGGASIGASTGDGETGNSDRGSSVDNMEAGTEEITGAAGTLPKYTIVDDRIVADQAYYRAKDLGSVVLQQGIEEIGQFSYARSTVSDIVIPEGTKKIGYGAFYHCDSLREVKLPATIETVEPKAFAHSMWLENFMRNGSEDFLISGNVLIAYRGDGGVVTLPEDVAVIAAEAFAEQTEITEVVLPESLRVIGEGAFEGCKNLRSVRMESQVEKIKDRAFAECALSDITLPASVKEIGLKAFDSTVEIGLTGNQEIVTSHELSAERLSNEEYRNISQNEQAPGVIVNGTEPAFAELEGAKRCYTLEIETVSDSLEMQNAYMRVFHEDLPEQTVLYALKLTDESAIPLTKLGKQNLTVTLPVPTRFNQENIKVVTLDRNGQLEAVDAERVLLDGVDAVTFSTNHPDLYGFYGDGIPLEQGSVIEVSAVIQDMSAAPASEAGSAAYGYMNLLKWSLGAMILLWGSVRIFRSLNK